MYCSPLLSYLSITAECLSFFTIVLFNLRLRLIFAWFLVTFLIILSSYFLASLLSYLLFTFLNLWMFFDWLWCSFYYWLSLLIVFSCSLFPFLWSFPYWTTTIISNDFLTLNQLNKFCRCINLGDLIAVLGSIDFVLGSVDL